MKVHRRLLGPVLIGALLGMLAVPALAGPAEQQTAPPGAVFALSGTPHLFIADERGILHWGGDTRALAGKTINWSDRREVSVAQLRSFIVGDPWLSSGLVKQGDPIYQSKWETSESRPTLLHIQSIADVELFGINGSNYGNFVLDHVTWEQRYGMSVSGLTRGTLPAAVPPAATATPAVTPTATPGPLKATSLKVELLENNVVRNEIEVLGGPAGRRYTVSARVVEWICSPNCDSHRTETWGPIDAGPADQFGRLIWRDEHKTYKEYTYTFTDVLGHKVSISFPDDRVRFGMS